VGSDLGLYSKGSSNLEQEASLFSSAPADK
jgi:hypothetical protein